MDLMAIWEVARSLWVVWLSALFVGIVVWTFLPRNKKRYEDAGRMIMTDEG